MMSSALGSSMNAQEKIILLEVRLRNLSARDSDNYGVRGKIIREIRKFQI
ncbi:MAG TPA: hypothetical protein IAC64_02465 [Candidatus Caccomorpha excrementavium]|nr:hypothetical protein [Candidatus Caccomorpha excrementavium]